MDRRQRKSRQAIFRAFTELLKKESYAKITVHVLFFSKALRHVLFQAHSSISI